MDRRDFLITGSAAAAGALAPKSFGQSSPAAGRVILPINRNWRYSPANTEAAHNKDFDDSQCAQIVIPHSNTRLPWHSFDNKTYQFVSIYRRRFKLPGEARGKR